MKDQERSKEHLVAELRALRRRVAAFEAERGSGDEASQRRTRNGDVATAEDEQSRRRAVEAETTLRQREEEYRGLLEACPDAVVMSDLKATVLFASRQTWKLLGLEDADDLVGQCALDYVIKEDRQRLAKNMARLLEVGVRSDTEYLAPRRDGTTVPTDVSSAVIRDAQQRPKALMAVIRDVSRRKQAEVLLQVSEERLRVAFEQAPIGMGLVSTEGVITQVNQALCRMSGYTEKELCGKSVHDTAHPEDREPGVRLFAQVVAGEIPSYTVEKRYVGKGGRCFWTQATGAALHDPEGKVTSVLGVLQDISERKRAEEALHREYRTLRHLLQSSDHERQLIAYEIHDGLAQQLAAAIMQFQTYDHLKQRQPKDAANAFEAGMTMLRQGHFEARRLISGVRPPILDEAGVVTAIAHFVNEQRRQKGPRIEFCSRVEFDRLVPVLENAIYRIVQEGLVNALRHSTSKKVRVELAQQGDRLRVEIQDWGQGFDLEHVKETCFGLEGIRQRARLLDGQFHVEAAPGKGTHIRVELPVVLRDADETGQSLAT